MWYGIPIYEKSEFNDGLFPSDSSEKMKSMERELRESDKDVQTLKRGMLTP
jgi:hypothetical protein